MRNGLFIGLLALASTAIYGAPCVPGSLQSYVTLGVGGCELGAVTFSNFAQVPGQFLAIPIDLTAVQVTPNGTTFAPTLNFALTNATANSGQLLELIFRFFATGPGLTQASVALNGGVATGDGVGFAVLNVCSGSAFPADAPSGCTGTERSALTFVSAADAILTDATLPTSSGFFDVFADIALDGGPEGTATLSSATIGISATDVPSRIPEPGTWVLLSSAFVTLTGLRAWRKPRVVKKEVNAAN